MGWRGSGKIAMYATAAAADDERVGGSEKSGSSRLQSRLAPIFWLELTLWLETIVFKFFSISK